MVLGENDTAAAFGDTDRPLEGKKRGSRSYNENSERKKVKISDKLRSKKSRHQRRSHDFDDAPSSKSSLMATSSDDSSEYYRDRRKRHKKEHRKSKKKEKKKKKKEKTDPRKGRRGKEKSPDDLDISNGLERKHILAHELCNLFDRHPSFASDLPVMLIRLGSGATFDFRSMTDQDAALGLVKVLKCLHPFGVLSNEDETVWSWKSPAGAHGTQSKSELVLVRVVRALLDQIGISIEAVEQYENPSLESPLNTTDGDFVASVTGSSTGSPVEHKVQEILHSFAAADLASDLAALCKMILDGECVNLDGLPNDQLKEALESLFDLCGLEKLEIEVDNDEGDTDMPFGYGLPESQAESESSKEFLSQIRDSCQAKPFKVERRSIQGPMLNWEAYKGEVEHPKVYGDTDTSDEDDGPMPIGAEAKAREATLTKEHIKASASRRAHELACAKQGIKIDAFSGGNVREEWMVVPGKFDFFDSVKSGQPIRSRTFEGKSKAENNNRPETIDPKVQAEIRAIREAYEDSRGPSLMDQHREATKQRLAQEQSAGKNSSSWKWDREKDLDAGRRVDKEALGMILGGAGSDLKNKFQSGL
jgi:Protein of unknown function (DUF3752)